uniref:Regulator of chromosome condensation (RCC1) repeat, putative n=1 Tax=Theileria annulata TaxID=5874 RepID=A0A3B0MZE5_THEAN
MWATKTIKKYWKSYKFRKFINSQKDELMQDLYKKEVQQITRNEIITSLSLLQKYKYGLLPLHVNVSTKLDEFYPNGWSNSLGMVLRVNEDKQVTNAAMGMFHTVLVLNGSQVYTYGLNDYNQLGYTNRNELTGNVTFRDKSVEKSIRLEPMVMIKEGLKVKEVTCGLEHTVMLLNDGSVYSWGLNRNGQCAQMQCYEVISTPTLVTFTNDCPVRVVTSGNHHVCCLNHDYELFVWGKAFHLGLNCSDLFRPMKLETKLNLKSVYAGKQVSYLLDQEHNLYSFGTTYNGQLGYPSNTLDKSFEVNRKKNELGNLTYSGETSGSTIFRFVLNQVADVSVGNNFTVALDVYGNLWQWGTFLVVNSNTETFEQKTEYNPFLVRVDKKILKSPLAKVSAGWWEVNLLTESLSLYGYNYLRLENKPVDENSPKLEEGGQENSTVYSPILFSYPGLAGMMPKDVKTLASPTITVTMVRTD